MLETPDTFAQAGVPVCASCGRRPGRVRVAVAPRGSVALCERCAQQLVAAQQHSEPASPTPALDQFGRDLSAEARAGRIDPVIGRDAEIEQVVEILARRRKNNAVLIGEAGVGKTAIAEGLARRVTEGDVPETLRDVRVVEVDLSGMLAGSQLRGQFEQRLKAALEEVVKADGGVVLFIDELHTLLGAGNAEGAMDAANMLKPMLARGELRVIGATTLAEFRKIERDGALARRFSPVTVDEPSVEDTVAILRGLGEAGEAARLRARLEELAAHKQAAVDAEAYERAAEIKAEADRVQAALDALGDAAAEPAETGPAVVGEQEVADVVAARTGIPVGELVAGELRRLQDLEADLHERVIGQDAAVEVVADTIRRARVGLSEGDRPLGSFLFLGPTGVGKT